MLQLVPSLPENPSRDHATTRDPLQDTLEQGAGMDNIQANHIAPVTNPQSHPLLSNPLLRDLRPTNSPTVNSPSTNTAPTNPEPTNPSPINHPPTIPPSDPPPINPLGNSPPVNRSPNNSPPMSPLSTNFLPTNSLTGNPPPINFQPSNNPPNHPPPRCSPPTKLPPINNSVADTYCSPGQSTSLSSSLPGDVTCFSIGGGTGSTTCWIFPPNISHSNIDGRNGSHACTVVTLVLGSVILHLDIPFPKPGRLSPVWCSLIEKGIRLGNRVYDESHSGVRDLSPVEAAEVLRKIQRISLAEPVAVRITDTHQPSRLQFQLDMLLHKKCAVMLVQGPDSFLLVSSGDGHLLAVDTHLHGGQGAVILTANAHLDMASFICALESTFRLEETSFLNFVVFS